MSLKIPFCPHRNPSVWSSFPLLLSHLSLDNTSLTFPGGQQTMTWDPIKWFVYQGSWRPLSALYKNSPPNPEAGYSWDRGHSQFRFSICLHSLLSAQSRQVAHTSFSHDTHSSVPGGTRTGCRSRSKMRVKSVCVYVCTGRGSYSSWRLHAYTQLATHCNGVTPFDKSIKEVFLSTFAHSLTASVRQTNVHTEGCLFCYCSWMVQTVMKLKISYLSATSLLRHQGLFFSFLFQCFSV